MEHLFQILEAINQNAHLNQKKIAELCGISVGKVNYLIQDLITEKYINCEKSGRNMNYFLTSKGIGYLKSGIEAYQEKKVNIHQEANKGIKKAVILAAGSRKDFGKSAGLMEIGGKLLIQRNIDILRECGITEFLIVTGYKKEEFEGLVKSNNIQVVENHKYKWTGSMASLACAEEFIMEDFLLIEDDILIEERAINEMIANPQRDCILITTESGSGDEAFVEIKNGYLHKISKDMHQFNKIDGEMIGVSKLSYEVYSKMVNDYRNHNRNPYMHYEYMLLDVSRQYNIGYLKIHNLVWGEIDSQKHYDIVTNKIFPILKRKEAEYRENQIKNYIIEALDVTSEDITEIQPFGGMTNKNFKVMIKDSYYVLRIPGNGTEQMIDRKAEKMNAMLASRLGIDADLIYFNAENGLKIAKFIKDAETLTSQMNKREDTMELTTSVLKKLHNSKEKMGNSFDVFEKIGHYEKLMEEANGLPYDSYNEVKAGVLTLQAIYQQMNVVKTPCHNDPVAENFVKSGDDKIFLIDWEYSGMNDPMWDIASHSLESGFSPEDEELFLTIYLEKGEIPVEIQQRILMNKIFQDFLWCIWTIIKEAKGDDFGTYGIDRFNRAKENLNQSLIREMTYEFKK